MNQLNDKLLKDYLLGKCTAQQMEEIDAWIQQSDENARWLFRVEELFHLRHLDKYRDEARIQRAELRLMKEIRSQHRVISLSLRQVMRYAAVLIAVVFMGMAGYHFFYNTKDMVEIVADAGVRQVMLPDGSKVWMNKGARIVYPEVFDADSRTVSLEGEARFEVTKDSLRPFYVHSDAMTVRVLGTIFNFNTRCSNNSEEVTLLEGRVEAMGRNDEGKIILKPHQKVILNKTSHIMSMEQVYAPLETLWYNHRIPFKNMRIMEIIHVLEKSYHVKIMVKDIDVNATYSGVVQQAETIDSVLDDLKFAIPFTYKRKGDCIYITSPDPSEGRGGPN